jgi:hypothetical protein
VVLRFGHDQEYMQDHLKFPELALMENFYFGGAVQVESSRPIA